MEPHRAPKPSTACSAPMQSAIVMLVAKADMRGRALGVISLAILGSRTSFYTR